MKGLRALKTSDLNYFLNSINKRFPDTLSFLNSQSFLQLMMKTIKFSVEGSGLLINRLLLPKINEAFDLLEQGNHHPYEIDKKSILGLIF